MWTNNAFRIVIKTLVVPNFPSPAMLVVTKPCALAARLLRVLLGLGSPAKIQEVTLMRPIHGNL